MSDNENMTVKVYNKSTAQTAQYERLNDALDSLEEGVSYEITALCDVSCFMGVNVPQMTELIFPSGTCFVPDSDASVNIMGSLNVADVNAFVGDMMVSLYIAPDAEVSGDGLSEHSNFTKHGVNAAVETDASYHWNVLNDCWEYVD